MKAVKDLWVPQKRRQFVDGPVPVNLEMDNKFELESLRGNGRWEHNIKGGVTDVN